MFSGPSLVLIAFLLLGLLVFLGWFFLVAGYGIYASAYRLLKGESLSDKAERQQEQKVREEEQRRRDERGLWQCSCDRCVLLNLPHHSAR